MTAGGAHGGEVGDLVAATPDSAVGGGGPAARGGSRSPGSGSARRVTGPRGRSWVTAPWFGVPTVTGIPSSSTRTGSIRALARSASTTASGNGIPATSAGPFWGTWTTNNGFAAAAGASVVSHTSRSSPSASRGAVLERMPTADPSVDASVPRSGVIVASNLAPNTSGNSPCTCSIPRSVSTTSADSAPRGAAAIPRPSASTASEPDAPDPPAPCSAPGEPTPHPTPRRPASPPTRAAPSSDPPRAPRPRPPAAIRTPGRSRASRAPSAPTRRRDPPSDRSGPAHRAPARPSSSSSARPRAAPAPTASRRATNRSVGQHRNPSR